MGIRAFRQLSAFIPTCTSTWYMLPVCRAASYCHLYPVQPKYKSEGGYLNFWIFHMVQFLCGVLFWPFLMHLSTLLKEAWMGRALPATYFLSRMLNLTSSVLSLCGMMWPSMSFCLGNLVCRARSSFGWGVLCRTKWLWGETRQNAKDTSRQAMPK